MDEGAQCGGVGAGGVSLRTPAHRWSASPKAKSSGTLVRGSGAQRVGPLCPCQDRRPSPPAPDHLPPRAWRRLVFLPFGTQHAGSSRLRAGRHRVDRSVELAPRAGGSTGHGEYPRSRHWSVPRIPRLALSNGCGGWPTTGNCLECVGAVVAGTPRRSALGAGRRLDRPAGENLPGDLLAHLAGSPRSLARERDVRGAGARLEHGSDRLLDRVGGLWQVEPVS